MRNYHLFVGRKRVQETSKKKVKEVNKQMQSLCTKVWSDSMMMNMGNLITS